MKYITNTDSSILPYNDNEMKYDIDLRMYVLTSTGFENYTGINLEQTFDTQEEEEAFLREISEDVYEYVYGVNLYSSIPYVRYKLAKDSSIRETFKQALITQARESYRSGLHLLKSQHGINIEKGKVISENDLFNKMIAPRTRQLLVRCGVLYSGFTYGLDIEDDGTF